MTHDAIMRMARENGIVVTGEAVLKLCALVAAAEREACAKLAGPHLDGAIAAAIRARGEA